MEKIYSKLKKISDKNSTVEYQAEIAEDVLERYVLQSLAEAAETFSLPGFRKGKVPHEKVREHVGEMELLEESANDALRDAMEEIATDEQLDIIGRPQLTVTKMAPKNPLEFRIAFAIVPEVSLPDYKKIAKQIFERKDAQEITEKEIDEAIVRIQKMVSSIADVGKAENAQEAAPAPLTDESVKQFGNFKTVADFRTELKKQLGQEKEINARQERREEVIREIVAHAKLKIPALLLEQQLSEFLQDRDEQLKAAGLTLDEYLKQINKTAEQLGEDERKLIENDLKTSLTVQAIRRKENLNAEDRDIHVLMTKLKLRYPERSEGDLHRTAEALILQDKLFALLEDKPVEPSSSAKDSDPENV